jgi:hypothetical protein
MIGRCRECGTDVETKTIICDECKKELRNERAHLYYLKNRTSKLDPDALLIVKDPDPLGGFHKGAIIHRWEAICMCRSNHASFTLGTILEDHTGQHFEVIGLPDGNQKLMAI